MIIMNDNKSDSESSSLQTIYSWIFPVGVNILLALLALWILVCFIHYGVKTRKFCCFRNRNALELLHSGAIYVCVVVCDVMTLVYYLNAQIYMNFDFEDNRNFCEVLADVGYISYGLMLMSVSLFLWTRQRAFYSNGMLNASYSKSVQILSAASIFFILVCGFVALLANTLPQNRTWNKDSGCVYVANSKYQLVQVVSIIVAVVFGQGTLLGLFVYALRKIRKRKTSSSSIEKSRRSQVIEKTMQKTVIFAFVSTAIDVLIQFLVHYISQKNGHRRYVVTVTSVNAFFHLLSLVLSFNQFKDILASPCM